MIIFSETQLLQIKKKKTTDEENGLLHSRCICQE